MRSRIAHLVRLVAASAIVAATLLAPGSVMAREPNGAATCVGIEMASVSPPGTSDEEPGGAPQFIGEVKEIAGFLGLRPGQLVAFIASLHAGSHAECDEALEE
jgi:hypothetical protein